MDHGPETDRERATRLLNELTDGAKNDVSGYLQRLYTDPHERAQFMKLMRQISIEDPNIPDLQLSIGSADGKETVVDARMTIDGKKQDVYDMVLKNRPPRAVLHDGKTADGKDRIVRAEGDTLPTGRIYVTKAEVDPVSGRETATERKVVETRMEKDVVAIVEHGGQIYKKMADGSLRVTRKR